MGTHHCGAGRQDVAPLPAAMQSSPDLECPNLNVNLTSR